MCQGRNKVFFFITDPVFLPQILIPDHKNVENFNPWSQKHWEFWSLIPKMFTILIPDSTKTLLIPIPSVVIPDPRAVIPDLIYLFTTLMCPTEQSLLRGHAFLSSFKEIMMLSSFHKLSGKWEWMRLIVTMLFE